MPVDRAARPHFAPRLTPRARLRRTGAVAEVRPVAVWRGEVLLLVGHRDVLALAARLRAASAGRVHVGHVPGGAELSAAATALAASAELGRGVVATLDAAVHPPPAVEALRRAVARRAPCRAVWVAAPTAGAGRDCWPFPARSSLRVRVDAPHARPR